MTRCGPSAVGSLRRWLPPTMPRRSSASTPRSWSFASNFPCRLKSEISDLKSEISNLESRISNLKSQISNLKSEISNLKSPSHAQDLPNDHFRPGANGNANADFPRPPHHRIRHHAVQAHGGQRDGQQPERRQNVRGHSLRTK